MTRIPALFGEGRALGVTFVTLGAVGQALAAGVAAFATRDIFQALHGGTGPVPTQSLTLLLAAGFAVAGLRLFGRIAAERVGQDYARALRRALFRHLTRMPAGAVAKRRAGALSLRFVGDLSAARNWAGLGIARIIAAVIVLPGAAAVLFILQPTLAAAALAPLAICLAVMAASAPLIAPLHRRLRRRRANLAIDMMERAAAAPELLLMGRARAETKRLERRSGALLKAAVRRIAGTAALRSVPDLGVAAASVSVLAAAFVIGAPPALAAAALAVLGILVLPLRDLAGVWDRLCAWRIARRKCQSVLHTPALVSARTAGVHRPKGPARLAFVDVDHGPLRGFTADAAPGAKIAIIGANGAGKSACLALASGLEQPDGGGSVELDGVDIRALPISARHRTILYLGPSSPILQGSLRRAMTLGVRPRPPDTKIDATARAFGLGPVLGRLGGLDGRVAEGGRNLSSGEVLRVHLVRAALARPRLLLLDAPDHVLDSAGRRLLDKLLRRTAATTLYVTQDIALATPADEVWHVEAGRILRQGPPAAVLGTAERSLASRTAA